MVSPGTVMSWDTQTTYARPSGAMAMLGKSSSAGWEVRAATSEI